MGYICDKLNNKNNQIIAVLFVSNDEKINFPVACKNSDIFMTLEERLYLEYPELKNKNICFVSKNKYIKRTATLSENGIKNGEIILIENCEKKDIDPDILNGKIIAVVFISTDQTIQYPVPIRKTDIFSNLEKKLYLKYPDLKNQNICFISNGNVVNRSATIEENRIKNGKTILIYNVESNDEVNMYSEKIEEIITVKFLGLEPYINYYISCRASDTFSQLEEKLFLEYPEYKHKNIYFIANGMAINRSGTVKENLLKNGTIIIIEIIDD